MKILLNMYYKLSEHYYPRNTLKRHKHIITVYRFTLKFELFAVFLTIYHFCSQIVSKTNLGKWDTQPSPGKGSMLLHVCECVCVGDD